MFHGSSWQNFKGRRKRNALRHDLQNAAILCHLMLSGAPSDSLKTSSHEVSRVTSHLTPQPENPKSFTDQDGTQEESMVVHACNPALGRMGKEDQEFEASLDPKKQN